MFDWARGSMLKQLVKREIFYTDWKRDDWLKNWHVPWLLGLVEPKPDMRVLDVGSATPHLMNYIHNTFGCEVHALDADPGGASQSHFGFPTDRASRFPNVKMHVGLAGQELLPAEHFDLITCISTLEHTYDHNSPLQADRPMPHLNALRDMVRMLKPGGAFLMNWDMYLDNMPQKFGYDFEIDYKVLKACGLRLMSGRRRLRNIPYIYSHPETLFFDPVQVLGFKHGQLRRGTAINILWQKPGIVSSFRLSPRPDLEAYYFPDGETQKETDRSEGQWTSSVEIDDRFHRLISSISDVLGRTDVDGNDARIR